MLRNFPKLKNIKRFNLFEKDPFLGISLVILILLTIFNLKEIKYFPYFIDWNTIIALSGLLIITTALEESGLFSHIAQRLISRLKSERTLALSLVLTSALFSCILTNDITLFIILPITLGLQKHMKNDIDKLIIFEAMAVNVGSLLTPIGNPQNIFLWHQWKIPFLSFVYRMLPVEILTLGLLMIFTFLIFKKKPIEKKEEAESAAMNIILFIFSSLLLAIFILSIEKGVSSYALGGVVLFYLLFFRKAVWKANWPLILLFLVVFVDVHLITLLFPLRKLFSHPWVNTKIGIYISGILFSQILSNVPAAILISKFSKNWRVIAYGVNIGGNGIVIASLANVIALKAERRRGLWKKFHHYSLPFLLISSLTVLLLLFYN